MRVYRAVMGLGGGEPPTGRPVCATYHSSRELLTAQLS